MVINNWCQNDKESNSKIFQKSNLITNLIIDSFRDVINRQLLIAEFLVVLDVDKERYNLCIFHSLSEKCF